MKAFITFAFAATVGTSLVVSQAANSQGPQRAAPDAQQQRSSDQNRQRHGNPALKNPEADRQSGKQEGRGAGGGTKNLEPGSNSFTEGQARSRLQKAGFQNLSDLKKDDQGIWRAKAMRNGRSVRVGLDYRGNIGAE